VLDWYWEKEPLASFAVITEVAGDGTFFDFRFPQYDQVDVDMNIEVAGPMDPRTLTPGCPGGVEFRPRLIKSREKIADNVIRFYTTDPEWCARVLTAGLLYCVRHYEYHAHALNIQSGSHLSLRNLTLYSNPGHGFLCGHGDGTLHHFQISGCRIKRRPGTDRAISCTADGCHINNTQGHFIMENCDFSYSGDDCLNIHDSSCVVKAFLDPHTVLVDNAYKGRNTFCKGDKVEFRNSDLSPSGFIFTVESVEYNAPKMQCKLEFKEMLPPEPAYPIILFNRKYDSGRFIVRNNFFHSNRARGMLLQASNGLVENNHFYKTQAAAIEIVTGYEARWSEGYGVDNVIFRGNQIESCDVNGWSPSVIYMGAYLPESRTNFPIFTRLSFEGNTIVDCPRQAFFLSSCREIEVKNNVIINPNTLHQNQNGYGPALSDPPFFEDVYRGTIMLRNASVVSIEGNKRLQTMPTLENGINCDDTNVNIHIDNNSGFEGR
jgi:hypothetical protein